MESKIYKILEEIRPEFDFKDSDDYIADGYLDSFDLTTLLAEFENTFDCIIDPMEVRAENFASVKTMVSMINRSKKG